MYMQNEYEQPFLDLILSALRSPGLLSPNHFNLARYSLNEQTRNRLLDPDISALEDYLIDNCGLPDSAFNTEMIAAFGDAAHAVCRSPEVSVRLSYQNFSWLLAWLNQHHPPAFFGEDSDSPLQVLQMAAALGFGEWAAAFGQIENGIDILLELARSPLERVRQAAVEGIRRLICQSWPSALRRLHLRLTQAGILEWRAVVMAVSDPEALAGDEDRILTAFEVQQQALRYLCARPESAQEAARPLYDALSYAPAKVAVMLPRLGLAQLAAWAAWSNPICREVVRANLDKLPETLDGADQVRLLLDRP